MRNRVLALSISTAVILVLASSCGPSDTASKSSNAPPSSSVSPSTPPAPPAETSARKVSGSGFGPVTFGMRVEEAEKALGVKLTKDTYAEDESCRYYTPAAGSALEGLSFMTSNGNVVRLDVHKGTIETDKGAKIGDTEVSVLAAYEGHIAVQPHKYTGPEGHYLVVTGADGKAQLVFETDGKVVTTYRAGQEPQVQYVEGCS